MRPFFLGRILVFLFLSMTSLKAAETPEGGLKRLQEGNSRFVKETLLHPDRTDERRLSLVERQSPYAVIVTCSDSRVVPEVIFDEGLGDLFVVRVAGNIIGATELESVEFAVDNFNPVIVLIMGHEKCGAVDAVLKGQTKDIPAIAALLEPSVNKARSENRPDILRTAIELNVKKMCTLLLKSPVISKKVQEKKVAVWGGYYNLQTGAVDFMDPTSNR